MPIIIERMYGYIYRNLTIDYINILDLLNLHAAFLFVVKKIEMYNCEFLYVLQNIPSTMVISMEREVHAILSQR